MTRRGEEARTISRRRRGRQPSHDRRGRFPTRSAPARYDLREHRGDEGVAPGPAPHAPLAGCCPRPAPPPTSPGPALRPGHGQGSAQPRSDGLPAWPGVLVPPALPAAFQVSQHPASERARAGHLPGRPPWQVGRRETSVPRQRAGRGPLALRLLRRRPGLARKLQLLPRPTPPPCPHSAWPHGLTVTAETRPPRPVSPKVDSRAGGVCR